MFRYVYLRAGTHRSEKTALYTLEVELHEVVSSHCECWEWNLGSLKEQLITESSLQSSWPVFVSHGVHTQISMSAQQMLYHWAVSPASNAIFILV